MQSKEATAREKDLFRSVKVTFFTYFLFYESKSSRKMFTGANLGVNASKKVDFFLGGGRLCQPLPPAPWHCPSWLSVPRGRFLGSCPCLQVAGQPGLFCDSCLVL